MTRCEKLRKGFTPKWSQGRMAAFLRVDQSAVCRMENGQDESGPVSALFDTLERAIEAGRVTAAMSPQQAFEALAGDFAIERAAE